MNIAKVFWLILIIIICISNVTSIKFAEDGEWKKGWICSMISIILLVISFAIFAIKVILKMR